MLKKKKRKKEKEKEKNLPANAGDVGLIPGSGRSPRKGNGNPLQYSCLENSIVSRAWWATVHGVVESGVTEHACTHKWIRADVPKVDNLLSLYY